MIIERRIDIFTSKQQTITNPVNRVGVMGKGLALEFKKRYPELITPYQNACSSNVFDIEGLFVFQTNTYRVLCFPTKHHWKDNSKLKDIDSGLRLLSLHYSWYGITSISIPPLGCGLGRLDFNDVKSLIYKYFNDHPLDVELILPN